MKIALAVDGVLDVDATLARYRLWGEDPANRLLDGAFLRVLQLGERRLPYVVRWDGPVDAVRLSVDVPRARGVGVADGVTAEVRRIFGLDFDLTGFYRLAKSDPALAALIERFHGLRPTLTPGGLEMLVGAITAQQVNLAFALALRGRVVRRYGTALRIAGETVYAFPDAGELARARIAELRAMQFSTRKAEYIRDLAHAVVTGGVDFARLGEVGNVDIIERLTALRGMGRWTADWFLARCLGRGDVCPAGDLAVRKAFGHYYGRGRTLTETAIRRRARAWGAHQTVAIHYLLAGMRRERAALGGGT